MKVIIAGGRSIQFSIEDRIILQELSQQVSLTEIVSGRALGADAEGEQWANVHGYVVTKFCADWRKYGRRAGPLRNAAMAEYADMLWVFPGGHGTASMIREARRALLPIIWVRDLETLQLL